MPIYREEDVVVKSESSGNGVASNLIWAFTTLAIVIILVWAIFYSGFLKTNPVKKIGVDVNVSAPQR
jgi:hypothetical protein